MSITAGVRHPAVSTRSSPRVMPALNPLGCAAWQAGLEEARASQLEALVGSLRSTAYRAAADSQAHGSRAAGAESRSAQLQAEVLCASRARSCRTHGLRLCPPDMLLHSCCLVVAISGAYVMQLPPANTKPTTHAVL
jgi:hypothetical protein